MSRKLAYACVAVLLAGCRSAPAEDAPPAKPLAPLDEEVVDEPTARDLPVVLRFEGASAVDRGVLEERARRVFVGVSKLAWLEPAAGDAAYLVRLELVDAGYLDARVTSRVDASDAKRPVVVLALEPGTRTSWPATRVTGNTFFDGDRAKAFFRPRRTLVDRAVGTERWFSRSELDAGVAELARSYRAEGFHDVEVAVGELAFDARRTSVVPEVRISEGVRRIVRDVQVEGLPEEEDVKVADLFRQANGRPWTPRVSSRLARGVEGRLGERGWADAACAVRIEVEADGATTVFLRAEPGERVRVAEVRFEGLERTREGFARRMLELDDGDWYDVTKVRTAFSRLLATGLFREVDFELVGEGPERTLVATAVEAQAIELFVEPGLGSYVGPLVKVGARHRNVFGTGRTVRAEAQASPKSLGAELGFTDPWWLGERTVTDVTLGILKREEPSFTFRNLGLEATIRTSYTDHWSVAWTYAYRRSEVLEFDADDPLVADLLGDIDVSSIQLTPRYEARDNLLIPRSGFRTEFSAEWADDTLGSEIDFVRLVGTHSQFFTLTEGTVVGANVRTGWIASTTSDQIPLQERFFNGGENSVRAFRESELGPVDAEGDPLGGEVFHLLSLELRQELTRRFEAATFFDTGSVASDHDDWDDLVGFRWGVGVGLRYLLPIGPLRFDLGFNPEAKGEEDDWVLHFALGLPF